VKHVLPGLSPPSRTARVDEFGGRIGGEPEPVIDRAERKGTALSETCLADRRVPESA
jgi:hypothetical protein